MIKRTANFLGLKGTWSWAKKQMIKGHVVSCRGFTGTLKYKIDDPSNKLLLCDFSRSGEEREWEKSYYHLGNEDRTDYYIVK